MIKLSIRIEFTVEVPQSQQSQVGIMGIHGAAQQWIQDQIHQYEPTLQKSIPRAITLVNEATGRWQYKHRSIRSAYHSLRRFLPLLYTYKNYPDLNIPTTTNHLDGGLFSPLKSLFQVHRGISKDLKRKLIIAFLENRVNLTPKS